MTKKKTSATVSKGSLPSANEAAKPIVLQVESPGPSALQLRSFEKAVQLFGERRLQEAREMFLEAVRGPAPHISDKARSYAEVCERRAGGRELKLSTAEDHFNYGVERLNSRDLEAARQSLLSALSLQPDAEHVLYTLSLCCGLAGDGNGAYENLKRAIDLEPRNRVMARQDPEFVSLAAQFPGLRSLLYSKPATS